VIENALKFFAALEFAMHVATLIQIAAAIHVKKAEGKIWPESPAAKH